MGEFFFYKCKEEYLDCKFPALMIERQAKGAFMNNIFFDDFFDEVRRPVGRYNSTANRLRRGQVLR